MDAQGKVLIKLDEDAGARRGRATRSRQGVRGDRHPVPAFLPQSRARAARQGDHRGESSAISSSPPRTSCRRNTASSSAPRRRRPTPMSGRACGAISARWATISMPPASRGDFLIVQSTGGLFGVDEAQSACIRMLESGPAAGVIGTKALCDRIGLEQRHRLRHGRHHRQGRRHPRRQRADDRQRADRRLCHRPAGADADDRHPGGRHRRRRRSRASRSAARCMSGRKAPARSPARCATASAAPSRPSPTPI